jgi:DNA invertase Pin-like site-specific DNA recombinase
VIVVDKPDRLGRGDVIAKLEYMAELNGARIEYVRGVYDTSTLEGIVQDSAGKMLSGI